MRRSLSAVPVMVGLLGIGCSVETSDPAPLGPESTAPAFHETPDQHFHPVRVGNPYPGVDLTWFINPNRPNISQAANGHTIDLRGFGPYTTRPKATVGGGGTFTWWDEDGAEVASGTWTATRFISYRSYGLEVWVPAPFNFYAAGGLMIMEVGLSTGHTGVLRIDCLIGTPNQTPGGAAEGIELALRGGPNFHKELTGATVFLRNP